MAFPALSSLSHRRRGFGSALLLYALGWGTAVGLAQFMPIADMCNPGLPLYVGALTLLLGAMGAGAALVAYLLGCRTEFVKGFLGAHSLILVGAVGLILMVAYNA